MNATSRLNREMRKLVEDMLNEIRRYLADNNTISLKDKLEIVSTMTKSVQDGTKSLESITKLLNLADKEEREEIPKEGSVEDILREMGEKK